jgi:hypothetical protein
MKAVLMAFVMTIRASSDIWVPRCFSPSISRLSAGTMAQRHYAQASQPSAPKTDRYRFCYIPLQQLRPFRSKETATMAAALS